MTLHLIRHAKAIGRSAWDGDDLDRPLDERGRAQAGRLAEHFAAIPIGTVLTSVAVRCHDTVAPLAEQRSLEPVRTSALTEGAPVDDLLALLSAAAAGDDISDDTVLCSHGDLIPEALNRLQIDGTRVDGDRGCAKGSVWTLEIDDGAIVRATYLKSPG